jgi:hypothetical protein
MPTYTILIKEKSSSSPRETQIKANSSEEAKRIAEGRGQKVIKINNIHH